MHERLILLKRTMTTLPKLPFPTVFRRTKSSRQALRARIARGAAVVLEPAEPSATAEPFCAAAEAIEAAVTTATLAPGREVAESDVRLAMERTSAA